VKTDDGVRIALKIFASQKVGTYGGDVCNEAGEVVGHLRVVLEKDE
jgi:hypothetical protein